MSPDSHNPAQIPGQPHPPRREPVAERAALLSTSSTTVRAVPPRRRFWGAPWFHAVLFVLTFGSLTFFWVWFHALGQPTPLPPRDWFSSEAIRQALQYGLGVVAILGSHEMGHYLACRHYGIPATLPYFIPGPAFGTFGAVIRIRAPIPDRRALFDVAAAGPLAGFAVALPLMVAGIVSARPMQPESVTLLPGQLAFGHSLLSYILSRMLQDSGSLEVGPLFVAAWFGMLVTAMNLFPVGQLDGGHVVYTVSHRLHRVLAWTTIVILAGFVVTSIVLTGQPSVYTLWCVVLLFMRGRHPRVIDESIGIGPGRRWIAVGLAVVFVLSFMPFPLAVY